MGAKGVPLTAEVTRGNPDKSSPERVVALVVLYASCSSSLSIVNKWAILWVPFPGVVTACQFLATALFVYVLGKLDVLTVEPLEKDKLVRMAPINIIFYLAIFTNGKVLQYSTVETFVAFRSLAPLLVACVDTIIRREPMPSLRTVICLVMIAIGAATYAYDDTNFNVAGYVWAAVYLVVIVTEMVYAKHITSTIGLSTWGLVLYQNTIALFIFPFASICTGEFTEIARVAGLIPKATPLSRTSPEPTISAVLPLFLSCVLGTGISFAGWGTRSAISATQFTVLGVACKLATILMNVLVWNHHASLYAQFSIVICIVSSVAYQQCAQRDKAERQAKPSAPPSLADSPGKV
ncbi:hypothetical protein CTAYLR_006689 [Chrysophaeum taylorii]|uniref:Sugar phosphate transporter domain-containing protein n=1 Tax=Chrysophaeum taylorii TaxID=2483200 RepID=A0AAD7UEY1_9STRA|nr:hypothetical protein CTAYLR_006689 [Chrysophaeum taylorii]